MSHLPSRRLILTAAFLLAPARAALGRDMGAPAGRRALGFTVWRNGAHIGRHHVTFDGDASSLKVDIQADMLIKFGPVPLFNYRHQASETWRDGRFVALESRTVANGRREAVSATRTARGVDIVPADNRRPVEAAADVHPLTHWNAAVLDGPLFNPQTGALLHERVSRSTVPAFHRADGQTAGATRYALAGDAEIVDWYDQAGVWLALQARAPDGSSIDYRRED